MTTLQHRLRRLEDATRPAQPVRWRVFYDNGDGSATDADTGEIVTLGAGAIRLTWGDGLADDDDDNGEAGDA